MTQPTSVNPDLISKFWLGKFGMTDEASRALDTVDVLIALRRHHNGDWGNVCAEDREANETALQLGGRLFSVYHDRKDVKFWIITEADRNTTTVLLPTDY
jgi:hypothetical protein